MKKITENTILQTIKKGICLFSLFSGCVLLAGCSLDQKGMVLLVDQTYRASVLGTESDGFSVPDGLLWLDGKLYIADEAGAALRVRNNTGEVETFCDASLGILSPEDLVVDAQGDVFFTDDDAGGVWKSDKQGNCVLLAGKEQGLTSTEGIALSPSGRILVGETESGQIYSVSMNGDVSVFIDARYGIKKPESMVYDNKGNLYIADNEDNVLYLLTSDKKLHRTVENLEGFSPETIWFSNGMLYITDSANGKLSRYSPEEGLQTIAVFGGKLAAVGGVTTDDNESIYLSIQTDLKQKHGYVLRLDKETLNAAR